MKRAVADDKKEKPIKKLDPNLVERVVAEDEAKKMEDKPAPKSAKSLITRAVVDDKAKKANSSSGRK